jgi:hypothetical protein
MEEMTGSCEVHADTSCLRRSNDFFVAD